MRHEDAGYPGAITCARSEVEAADGVIQSSLSTSADIREKPMEEIATLKATLTELERAISHRPLQLGKGAQKARFLLLLSAIENSKGFVQLLDSPYSFASVANARSAFEALIDFRVLEKDPNYLKSMEHTFLKQKKSALSAVIRATRIHSPNELIAVKGAEKKLSATSARLQALKTAPKQAKSDLIATYVDNSGAISALWMILCDISHNNINSLAIRHLPETATSQPQIIINAKIDAKLVEAVCPILNSMFLDAQPFIESCRI